MANHCSFHRLIAPAALAVTIGLSTLSLPAMAHPGDVNSTNNGQNVQGGTYYNTPGDHTTFVNTSGTGIYIHSGITVTGREVSNAADPSGSLTGNGGWINISAPHQVVRIDGNINVNAIRDGGGGWHGDGGKVTVTSAYLYQSGQIYANGHNGGHVSFNVGSLTMRPTAAIYAQGHGGNGGVVHLGDKHSHGVFDIQHGAIVNVSGKIIGRYDVNLIRIEGGLINLNGILMANGVNATKPSGNGGDGGTITLLARGNTTGLDSSMLSNASFMNGVHANLVARDTSLRVNNYDGWIRLGHQASIQANGGNGMAGRNDDGGNGADGGYIALTAKCGIENNGSIQNNGGKGGDAPLSFGQLSVVIDHGYHRHDFHFGKVSFHLEEVATGKDGGNGGDGGNIDFQYGTKFVNNGSIQSIGGNGGKGGDAIAFFPLAKHHSWAYGADGGNGSDGGNIDFTGGSKPIQNGDINQHGGIGGAAGHGYSQTPGNSFNGDKGTHGDRGIYDYTHVKFCGSACDNSPGGGPIVPPIIPPIVPPGVTPPAIVNNSLNPDFNGLFQNGRPIFNTPVNNQIPPIMLAMGQSKMFLAKTYSSVTQEMLTLALREYTRLLTIGRPANLAAQEMKELLERSGVNKDIAQALLERIHDGKLTAGDVVVQMLNQIADTKTSMLPPQP